jgi:hypothetical protein
MGFLVKSALILLLIAVAGGFIINQIPSWKQRVVEVVNPAAKEARLLGELKTNLEELDKSFNSSDNNDPKKRGDLISKSKTLVDEISSINQKNSGIIKQGIGKIIDSFIDKTPFPADHLQVKSSDPSSSVCPPTK